MSITFVHIFLFFRFEKIHCSKIKSICKCKNIEQIQKLQMKKYAYSRWIFHINSFFGSVAGKDAIFNMFSHKQYACKSHAKLSQIHFPKRRQLEKKYQIYYPKKLNCLACQADTDHPKRDEF